MNLFWKWRKSIRVSVVSLCKAGRAEGERSQGDEDLLSKMQAASGSHRHSLQSGQKESSSQRRAAARTRKKRLWWTEVSTPKGICKNNEETDLEVEMQGLRFHEAQGRYTTEEIGYRVIV